MPNSTLPEGSQGGGRGIAPLREHLFLVLEADRPAAGGARVALSDVDEVVIGRGEPQWEVKEERRRRQIIVQSPSPRMSSRHARLVRSGGGWIVEDAGSKNGTFVAGERITRARVGDGDIIQAGRTFFVLRSALPTPESTHDDIDMAAMCSRLPWQRTLYPELHCSFEALQRVAKSAVPVILCGETGTGKELLARAVHDGAGRAGPFVPANCGALPATLLESLLFGHVRGSFSGAMRDEPGLIRSAHGGTLFLDEIGDLPLGAQVALLRVLQEREVLPVGATRAVAVDARIVCATHRALDSLARQGSFRPDLLTRLDGFRFTVPPLRRRREDLGLLVAALLPKLAPGREESVSIEPSAARALLDHDWPGNVRELEQALARSLALSPDGHIRRATLNVRSPPAATVRRHGPDQPLTAADAGLRERLAAELERCDGNISRVAKAMGKARMQIQRWIRRFELDPDSYRKPPDSRDCC